MLNNPTIIWEKWTDPYGKDNEQIPNWDNQEDTDLQEQGSTIQFKQTQALLTNFGIIPYNEHTDCCKIFNFWIGHTNFTITNNIAHIMQHVDGVETLDIFTRYRFRVSFGKAFIDREVMNNINSHIIKLLKYDN